MKTLVAKVDATPSKRIFLSIISDYDLEQAICELIDNSLDSWIKTGRKQKLKIEIELNLDQQTICVEDNSGGIAKADLKFVVGPGQTGNAPTDPVIGIFGVGTKRAVVALAQEIKITTRYKNENTYMVEFDDAWLHDDEWELAYYQVDSISQGSTKIFLQRLRNKITDKHVKFLRNHLGATYARFLVDDRVDLVLNSKPVKAVTFEKWAYPPKYPPREYRGELSDKKGNKIKACIRAGLSTESSPAEAEYGVYFYCNDRLVASAVKDFHVGFGKGLAGLPHPNISLVRVSVSLNGPAELMPWNSSKSGINYNHQTFYSLQLALIPIVKYYASLSRSLQGNWPEEVFRYKKGKITLESGVDFADINSSNFPPVPRSKLTYAEKTTQLNKGIIGKKPWTKGLVGGVVASEILRKKTFDEKNRIALIILDSTLEIAFKEFLVNESGNYYTDAQLLNLFGKRHLVEQEIKKYVTISKAMWKQLKYYYNLRCKLVHERASTGIADDQISDFEEIVKKVLDKLFKLKLA